MTKAEKKAAKKAAKKVSKPSFYNIGEIFAKAMDEANKAGVRKYPFIIEDKEHVFEVRATDSTNLKGDACVRKGLLLNGKQITAQASRLLFYVTACNLGNKPEGRAVAQTVPATKAVEAWQTKHGYLLEPIPEPTKEETGFSKKQLKSKHKLADLKKSLPELYSKKECKKIFKILGEAKKFKQSVVMAAMDKVVKVTFDEMKAIF